MENTNENEEYVWLYAPRKDEGDASVPFKYDMNKEKTNVSKGGDENIENIKVKKDRDWKEDKEGGILLYASSEEKVEVIVEGENKEMDDVVDVFNDSNSKDVIFLYASSVDKEMPVLKIKI